MDEMREISEYLINNYYIHYKGDRPDIVPTPEQIEIGYKNYPDKFVIIRDEKIRGIAIFVTLSDKTWAKLETLNITRMDVLNKLLDEHGPNVHFLLLCADGMSTILTGIHRVKNKIKPKTISWWNQDLTKLHSYKVRY